MVILVQQLRTKLSLLAGGSGGEADLQARQEFTLDDVGVGRDHAALDEETGPARDFPLDQRDGRFATPPRSGPLTVARCSLPAS